jgi:hypothetical protein
MWEPDAGNIGQPDRAGDEVSLRPEFFGYEGDCGYASSSKFYAVTHGAGGAASSMAPGGNDRLAAFDNFIKHRI